MDKGIFDLQNYRDLEHLELYARQVVEGFITGLHKSPYHGFSVEFSEHRIYNPGESTRNIDWKLFARTDRLYTKRYEEETNLRCQLVIDGSGSMFYPPDRLWNNNQPNKILFSTIASMAIMQLMRKQRDAVGLNIFGQEYIQTATRSTRQHHRAIVTELTKLLSAYDAEKNLSNGVSMAEMLHLMAERIHKRSLVILFSDLYDMQENPEGIMDGLKHLKYNKHEVILFWTTDHSTELNFDFEERPYRFVDMESGAALKLNPGELKKEYLSAMQNFREELRVKCMQYKIDLIEADVAKGYYSILQSYLMKRKRMF